MKYMTTIIIPETGDAERLFPRFPEAQVRMDPAFRKFIGSAGFGFALREPLACSVHKAEGGGEFEDLLGSSEELNRDQVCAILSYLTGDGWSLLEIPAGQEEVNLVVGYVYVDGNKYVLYVEHEMEEGKKEEIHLHVTEPDDEEGDALLVLQMT